MVVTGRRAWLGVALLAFGCGGGDANEGSGEDGAPSDAAGGGGPTEGSGGDGPAADEPVPGPPISEGPAASNDTSPPPAGGSPAANTPTPTTPTASTRLDVLFVIDNSLMMQHKQALLSETLGELVDGLLAPPVTDAHFGVITTSLGAYGAQAPCSDPALNQRDMAHLVGALRGDAPVLGWCSAEASAAGTCTDGMAPAALATALADQVDLAGAWGCGWEANLEAWYRFLIEPAPYTEIVRQSCTSSDTGLGCVGPATDASGTPLVDTALLAERQAFLREDSVLLVVALSDEDDCSMIAGGQTWLLSQVSETSAGGTQSLTTAFKGSAECATNPNDPCCVSCGAVPPSDCPTTSTAGGITVSAGCEEPKYPSVSDLASQGLSGPSLDNVNLRCFDQKRRFGVDYLYPVQRYANALTLATLCPTAKDLDPESCADPSSVIPNPLFAARAPSDVILANLVGVPWQDLAVDAAATELELRAAPDLEWAWLIGERQPANGIVAPEDPLMLASVEPRTGVQPSTGVALQPPDAARMAQPGNGHEWNIADRDELQLACLFELASPVECPGIEDFVPGEPGCQCTWYADELYRNPVCQAPDGSYGATQYFAEARPGTRQLQLSYDVREQAVVGSACAKQTANPSALDYGYRPEVRAIVRRVAERFGG